MMGLAGYPWLSHPFMAFLNGSLYKYDIIQILIVLNRCKYDIIQILIVLNRCKYESIDKYDIILIQI
jgi:hypothetical protein